MLANDEQSQMSNLIVPYNHVLNREEGLALRLSYAGDVGFDCPYSIFIKVEKVYL